MSSKLYLHFPPAGRPAVEVAPEQEIIAGRAAACEVDLSRYFDSYLNVISRQHFRISYLPNQGFAIVDMSHNGTQVGTEALVPGRPRILRHGDRITLARNPALTIGVTIEADPAATDSITGTAFLPPPAPAAPRPGIIFDESLGQFIVDGRRLPIKHLTRLEGALLRYLADHAGKPCAFEGIAAAIWNDPGGGPDYINNTISKTIGSLRRKLNGFSPRAGECIQNIRGRGYELVSPQEEIVPK